MKYVLKAEFYAESESANKKILSSIEGKLFKNTTFPGLRVRLFQIFIAPKDAPQKVALGRSATNLRSREVKIPKNAFIALKKTLEKCCRRKKQVSHRTRTDLQPRTRILQTCTIAQSIAHRVGVCPLIGCFPCLFIRNATFGVSKVGWKKNFGRSAYFRHLDPLTYIFAKYMKFSWVPYRITHMCAKNLVDRLRIRGDWTFLLLTKFFFFIE